MKISMIGRSLTPLYVRGSISMIRRRVAEERAIKGLYP